MSVGRVAIAELVACICAAACQESRPTDAAAFPLTSAVTSVAQASASAQPGCPAVPGVPLSDVDLDQSAADLRIRNLGDNRLRVLGEALGVSCDPTLPGFARAFAGVLARFELKTLPLANEVDGKPDDQTLRFLAMLHPTTQALDHPCRTWATPAPEPSLSAHKLARAIENNGERGGKTEGWIRELQRGLGVPDRTGKLDAPTLQRLADWQRRLKVKDATIQVSGLLDAPTVEALQRAFPRLQKSSPSDDDPLGYLPACVAEWKEATDEQRTFMMRVYETQRSWAAQRRAFAGQIEAADIENGRTAQRDAAQAAKRLLQAARATLTHGKKLPNRGDLQVVFGYRSPAVQVTIWERHFPDRYRMTEARRDKLRGGKTGHEAVVDMAKHCAERTAAPGYSLHNEGMALDLSCVTPRGQVIGPNGPSISAWKHSWCFKWLKNQAAAFGFHQNPRINEPWHWEYHPPDQPLLE